MYDRETLEGMSTPVLTILAAYEVWQLHRPSVEEFDSLKLQPFIDKHNANLLDIDDVLVAREREGR